MATSLDIVAIGEAMVEFNQTGDRNSRTYLQGFGGDTSNAMIAASRLLSGSVGRRLRPCLGGAMGQRRGRAGDDRLWCC